jgi:hypothetical protein
VNPFSVIDRVQLRFHVPPPGLDGDESCWMEHRDRLFNSFNAAINRGVFNEAAEAIILSFGRDMLRWMREYNREQAHKYRRYQP